MQEGTKGNQERIGVVGIVISDRGKAAARVNEILGQFGEIIVGRMGVPYRERGLSVIALIVDGTTDQIGAMTGRLGGIPGVQVKSALANKGSEVESVLTNKGSNFKSTLADEGSGATAVNATGAARAVLAETPSDRTSIRAPRDCRQGG